MRNSNSRKFGCEDFLAEVGTFISKRDLPKRAQKESQVLLSTKIAFKKLREFSFCEKYIYSFVYINVAAFKIIPIRYYALTSILKFPLFSVSY